MSIVEHQKQEKIHPVKLVRRKLLQTHLHKVYRLIVSHSHSWLAPCPPAMLWLAGLAAAGGIAGARGTTLDRPPLAVLDLLASSPPASASVAFSSRR